LICQNPSSSLGVFAEKGEAFGPVTLSKGYQSEEKEEKETAEMNGVFGTPIVQR